jgi:hypothetical protein
MLKISSLQLCHDERAGEHVETFLRNQKYFDLAGNRNTVAVPTELSYFLPKL